MCTWTKAATTELMQLLVKHPNLYESTHEDYASRIKRKESYIELANMIQKSRPGTSAKDVLLKMKTLRTQYAKEKQKVLMSKRRGVGTEEVYVPKLWCFDNLKFLDNKTDIICGETIISFSPLDVKSSLQISEAESPVSSGQAENTPSSTFTRKRSSPSDLRSKTEETLVTANKIMEKMFENKPSPLRPFLDNMECELKVIKDEDLLLETKWKLMDVLREAQLKQKSMSGDTRSSTSTSSMPMNLIDSAMEDVFDEADF